MPKVVPATSATIQDLKDVTRVFQRVEGFSEILAALQNGSSTTIDGAWGSAAALTAAALGLHVPKTLLVVLAHVGDLDDFADDIASFAGTRPEIFPHLAKADTRTHPALCPDSDEEFKQNERTEVGITKPSDEEGQRFRIARRLATGQPFRFVLSSIQALAQFLPNPQALMRSARTIRVGESLAVEELVAWLLERGFVRVEVVEVPGEFSLRGGILDFFPPTETEPVRIEFFGDEIESIRLFDAESQRSLERWESLTINTAIRVDSGDPGGPGHLLDYLPADSWIALVEPEDLRSQLEQFLARSESTRGLFSLEESFQKLLRFSSITISALSSASLEQSIHLRIESVERFSGELAKVKTELDAAAAGDRVLIACHNEGEAARLAEVFSDTTVASEGRLTLTVGHLRSGFHLVDARILVLGDHELFARAEVRRPTFRRRYESRAIDSFLDLNENDLVVHVTHGIARYRGLQIVDQSDEHGEEQLVLEFAERTKLFVPIAAIELVQKYVGGGRGEPPLSKLGSGAWEKKKKRVAEAVVDLATELLQIQAQRAAQPGFPYPPEDSRWMSEFEAAFPYQETPDQVAAIAAIKTDMAQPRPMDRLICGDVGYGKTEVALRAVFKAIDAGKQVAVLVPTTVLAEQHHRTFTQRLAEFPFLIEVVNRFRPRKEIKRTLRSVEEGKVDVLIGTHRILQRDVRFKDLGLVIIDEEQRFGVEDKEWLKSLRATVDLLTLSATPIPRTLHMSLLGLRDISNLETPPPDRKAIETRITRWDDEIIRRAINRELDRDGQVYFVHNRVHDIHHLADRVQRLVPQARIQVAHGQMSGDELEKAMLTFVRHGADVLVATTIIESGLDIPNANTIFIHEADHYGLADLHQLRGRVGRFKHKAYAYLLLESDKPVTPNAVKRLKAIEELTDLGAGFKIALRDLEIRGAGNILGPEQSGHIEAVGYELYCTLLEGAVRALTGRAGRKRCDASVEIAWRAYLPKDYVPSAKVKMELYRRLGRLNSLESLSDFRQELLDRFGPIPAVAENLLAEAELRILADRWQIARIHVEDEFAVLTFRNRLRIEALSSQNPSRIRIVDERSAYVPLEQKNPKGAQVALALRTLLAGSASPPGGSTPTSPGSPLERSPRVTPTKAGVAALDSERSARVGSMGERLRRHRGRSQ